MKDELKKEKEICDTYAAYDVFKIPDEIMNMSLEEIQAKIAEYEEELKSKKDIA